MNGAPVQLSLLGAFECRSAGGAPIDFPTRKVEAVMAYLGMNSGRYCEREKIAALLWEGSDPERAQANCRQTLSRLRKALASGSPDGLTSEGSRVGVRPEAVAVDALEFQRLAAIGTPERLERALALYRGDFLEGFFEGGEAFEDWLSAERRRLQETFQSILERLLDHYFAIGGIDRAIQMAIRLLAIDPLREGTHRTMMRLYMSQERLGSALDQYNRCRDLLEAELGVTPGSETEELKTQILGLAPGATETDLRPEPNNLPETEAVVHAAAEARKRRRDESTGRPSIVVMPFSETGSPDHHLADGIVDDIATELGRFHQVDVIAPLSARTYHGVVAPEDTGAELGADYVLTGSVRLHEEGQRITARLIATVSGRQIWAERYECGPSGLLEAQDQIVRRAVSSMVGGLEEAALEMARRKRPQDWEAYDLWLQGSSALRRSDLSALREARRFFERAVAKDPHFARAYVGLAVALLNEWACFSWNHWGLLHEDALQLARKAVELDDRDNRAHCMLGVAELFGGDDKVARRDSDVLAHVSVGMAVLGEHDIAVESGRRALYLAPHHPEWYVGFAGNALFTARLYEEAIQTMLEAPQAICDTPAFLAASYAQIGKTQDSTPYREVVYRHHRVQLSRGWFPEGTSCIDWLLGLNPYRRKDDLDHMLDGLRKAGFE
jgi:DNA-binding SARP family transcriptional activator